MSTPSPFRSYVLGDLLDLWDEPLDSETRAQVLEALEERGYRTQGLPAPPIVADGQALQVAPLPPSGAIGCGQLVLGLTGVIGVLVALSILPSGVAPAEVDSTLVLVALLLPSLAFLGFLVWSFRAPEDSLPPAAALYGFLLVSSFVLEVVSDSATAFDHPARLLVGGVFLMVLFLASRQALRNAAASAAATGDEDE